MASVLDEVLLVQKTVPLMDCGESLLPYSTPPRNNLVGGLEHEFYDFPETVGNVIIPTGPNSMIFQRGRLNHQPVTIDYWTHVIP